jgi:FG-GAP-like repeat/FG-GAP repeat
MTYQRALKAHVLNIVSLLSATLAILIALLAPAQLTGGGQPSAKATVVPTPQDASPPLFLPPVTYDSGGIFPESVAVADLNGDGKPDLVVGNFCYPNTNCQYPPPNGAIGVLLGNGDGTFQPAVSYSPGGSFAQSVAVADVNSDGKPDVLVAVRSINLGDGAVGVLLGNGDGTFQPAVTYDSGGQSAWSIAVGDFNADGKPDLVLANADSSSIGVLVGNGDGTFQSAVIYGSGGYSPRSAAIADVNDDSKPDILVANLCLTSVQCDGEGAVGVLLGNGDGTFQPVVTYDPGGDNSTSVVGADVNGDGRPDLLVVNACTITGGGFCASIGTVGVLLGNGDGTFQQVVTYTTGGGGVGSVAVADVNGDAKPDLVVVSCCGNGPVGVLVGNGDGTFQPPATFSSGGVEPESVAVVDVNGDAKPDLLVPNFFSNTVGVLLNNTADTTPPVITLSVTPKVLWPPNGKMVPVTVSGTITDTGSGVNVNSAAYVVNDEYSEVQPQGAITLGPGGAYSFTVLLQASRLGTDLDGRRYTITVRAKDNAGNSGSKTSVVTVPHGSGKLKQSCVRAWANPLLRPVRLPNWVPPWSCW